MSRVVYGLHPVRELLRAGQPIQLIEVADTRDPSDVLSDLLRLASEQGVEVRTSDRQRLDALAEGGVHQGVVAKAPPFPYAGLDDILARAERDGEPALLVALDGITDPHNVGSIARTAVAMGAHGLIIPSRRAAQVTPTVEKAAAGALAHLPLVRVTNLVRALKGMKDHGLWIIGLDLQDSRDVRSSNLLTEPVALVVGAEGSGLARLSQVQCDQMVYVPMRGLVDSLNASVAAGLVLWEVRRQRDAQHLDTAP